MYSLNFICNNNRQFLDDNNNKVLVTRDLDGDIFALYSDRSGRIAIQSVTTEINPIIYGGKYEIIRVLDREEFLKIYVGDDK